LSGGLRSPQNGDVVVARLDDRVEPRSAASGYDTLVTVDGKSQLEIVVVAHAVYTTGRVVR
jgi:hypothetical protein